MFIRRLHFFICLGYTACVIAHMDTMQKQTVSHLYSTWYSRPLHSLLTTTKWPSVVAGICASLRVSSYCIPSFVKKYGIDMTEYDKNISEYKTFNDFFIRTLAPGKRPIDSDIRSLISPADGAILVVEHMTNHTVFPVKGVMLNLEALVKNAQLAELFYGGTAFIIRLAPWDYHRFHFPLAGIPSKHRIIHGAYESVHPHVYSVGIQPLEINERHLICYETDAVGTVALIPVGALFVGAITETYTPGIRYQPGDEMGYFSFGGSTIVMLFKKDTLIVNPLLVSNSHNGKESPIKMGQSLAICR